MEASRGIPVAVASGYMRDCLVYNGFNAGSITLLPYFCPGGEESNEGNYLLFVGRIYWQKGLRLLLDAMKLIPGVRLKVAGVGPDMESCKKFAQAAGLESRVEFLGLLSSADLRKAYASCLALAVPSIWPEPFGLIGIEAMAAAKPVVAFDVGGVREWLADGENGYAVRPLNTQGLAAPLVELVSSVRTRHSMGARGREIWAERFRIKHHMAGLCKLLESVADTK
jgi:glycosyltransferase involved in cell wall biosynthesis